MSASADVRRTLSVALRADEFADLVADRFLPAECITYGPTGPLVGRFVFVTIPEVGQPDTMGPYVVSDRGLYLRVSERNGWFSRTSTARFIDRAEIAACRRSASSEDDGSTRRRLDLVDKHGSVLASLMNYYVAEPGDASSESARYAEELGSIAVSLGLPDDDRFDF